MAFKYIIKSGESVCIDGPAAFFTNSRFIMLSSFQENAPTIQLINGALLQDFLHEYLPKGRHKKNDFFLGKSPKQRTSPTHPYGLGLK